MSLVDNISDVSFTSTKSIDKIVGVYSGTFNKSTDTTTRTGGITSIKVYPIPHGKSRPVFTTLLWSSDGTTWYDGGASDGTGSSIAFSDSTNIYVVASSASGTQYYRVIAYWIDTYDNTDPLVESFTPDVGDITFDSRLNYQKIALEGSTTYSPGTFGSSQLVDITHPLGYKPNARAFFEPIDGEVWPINAGGVENPFLYSFTQDEAYLKIYDSYIEIEVLRFSNDTRNIWYKVYYDD